MRATRFRGRSCSFVVCSRSLLCLPSHWVDGASLICPRAVERECWVCPGVVSRWVGYVAAREVLADGGGGELMLVELPESLARMVGSLDLAVLQGPAFMVAAHGVGVIASREAERRPWRAKRVERVNPKTCIDDGELIDSVARLYGLPVDVDGDRSCLSARAGAAIAARHEIAARTSLRS